MKKIFTAILFVTVLSAFSTIVFAQTESRETLLQEIEAKRAQLATLEKRLLEPSDEDRANFAEFLKQPNTGLIRLLPREVYDEFRNKPGKLTIRGGGAYYSFFRLTHEYGYGSDLELGSGHLSVGFAGADYGLMTTVDIPLEEISSAHPAATFLANYNPPTEESKVREESRSFRGTGKIIDGLTYRARLPVRLNTTYLLRSINFGDSDIFVAFKVLRKDTDESVIIAWKLVEKYPKPVLTRTQQGN